MQTREIRNLDELMDGALAERFNYELNRVLSNVFDPNTSPKQKRSISITVDIMPNERRDAATFKVDVKSKLAQAVPVAQTVLLSQADDGTVTATEITGQAPGQLDFEGNEEIPNIVKFGTAK